MPNSLGVLSKEGFALINIKAAEHMDSGPNLSMFDAECYYR